MTKPKKVGSIVSKRAQGKPDRVLIACIGPDGVDMHPQLLRILTSERARKVTPVWRDSGDPLFWEWATMLRSADFSPAKSKDGKTMTVTCDVDGHARNLNSCLANLSKKIHECSFGKHEKPTRAEAIKQNPDVCIDFTDEQAVALFQEYTGFDLLPVEAWKEAKYIKAVHKGYDDHGRAIFPARYWQGVWTGMQRRATELASRHGIATPTPCDLPPLRHIPFKQAPTLGFSVLDKVLQAKQRQAWSSESKVAVPDMEYPHFMAAPTSYEPPLKTAPVEHRAPTNDFAMLKAQFKEREQQRQARTSKPNEPEPKENHSFSPETTPFEPPPLKPSSLAQKAPKNSFSVLKERFQEREKQRQAGVIDVKEPVLENKHCFATAPTLFELSPQKPIPVMKPPLTKGFSIVEEAVQARQQQARMNEYKSPTQQDLKPHPDRMFILVPFCDNNEASTLGAKWYQEFRLWYIPQGKDRALFRWPDALMGSERRSVVFDRPDFVLRGEKIPKKSAFMKKQKPPKIKVPAVKKARSKASSKVLFSPSERRFMQESKSRFIHLINKDD